MDLVSQLIVLFVSLVNILGNLVQFALEVPVLSLVLSVLLIG